MKVKVFYLILTAIIYAAAASLPCFSQGDDDKGAIYTVQGEVTSLDTVAGTIVVRWMQSDQSIEYDEIVFKIPEELKITKGTDTVGPEDIDQFDRVVLQYRKTQPPEPPTVISMTIEETD